MGDLRIGNAKLSVEGIRPLKKDVALDDNLKSQLSNDGFDEVIFQKGDQLYIAYQKNMNLDNLQLNGADFNVNSAYDMGQLSQDGDAVKVLHFDDENKDSLWVAPFKSFGSSVKSLVNHPFGKSALLGFASGTAMSIVGSNTGNERLIIGTAIGTGAGSVVGALKAAEEYNAPEFWDTGAGLGSAAVGYALGMGTGHVGTNLVKSAIENPKVAAMAAGITALVVGTGIVLDQLSDNDKPSTYRVINQISAK